MGVCGGLGGFVCDDGNQHFPYLCNAVSESKICSCFRRISNIYEHFVVPDLFSFSCVRGGVRVVDRVVGRGVCLDGSFLYRKGDGGRSSDSVRAVADVSRLAECSGFADGLLIFAAR